MLHPQRNPLRRVHGRVEGFLGRRLLTWPHVYRSRAATRNITADPLRCVSAFDLLFVGESQVPRHRRAYPPPSRPLEPPPPTSWPNWDDKRSAEGAAAPDSHYGNVHSCSGRGQGIEGGAYPPKHQLLGGDRHMPRLHRACRAMRVSERNPKENRRNHRGERIFCNFFSLEIRGLAADSRGGGWMLQGGCLLDGPSRFELALHALRDESLPL